MAITFKTQPHSESLRDINSISTDLVNSANECKRQHILIRMASAKCIDCARGMKILDRTGNLASIEGIDVCRDVYDSVRASKPDYSPHTVHAALESEMSDYAKKVTTFAQTLITTVKQYSVNLFDLFVKKNRVNKSIDTSKFVEIDASMRMIVMTYGDYCELGNPIANSSVEVCKDLQSVFPILGKIRKAMTDGEDVKDHLAEFTKKIHEGKLISYLKDHSLAKFTFGQDVNGNEGLISLDSTDRFSKLEESQLLNEAGWTDVDKIKGALILKESEEISKNISSMYKAAVDIMDETRRMSIDFGTKDPYVCTVLVKYGSLLAQMVNYYTKTFDMCWTTCLRVSQACLIESK